MPPKIEFKPEDIELFWEMYDGGTSIPQACEKMGWLYKTVTKQTWYKEGIPIHREGRKHPQKEYPHVKEETIEEQRRFWDKVDSGQGILVSVAEMGWKFTTIQGRNWYILGKEERRKKRIAETMTLDDLKATASGWVEKIEEGGKGPDADQIRLIIGLINSLQRDKTDAKDIPQIVLQTHGYRKS
jgi:hypothetical protein